MDLVATLKNKPNYTGYGVIDWKTSIAMSPTYKGQIPAYDRLCKVNDIQTGNWGCIVRLRQTGQIALANFMPRQELDVELQYFLNALTAYRRYVFKGILKRINTNPYLKDRKNITKLWQSMFQVQPQ